jgi:hypothetical protein
VVQVVVEQQDVLALVMESQGLLALVVEEEEREHLEQTQEALVDLES